jgi:hypothetical protein
VEIDRQTIVTPSPHEGEITRASKAIDPFWKFAVPIAAFISIVYGASEAWIKIKSTEREISLLKEQVTRQYNTHKSEIDGVKKDTDDELDVLEEDIDKLKEKILYHEAYEQARKEK